MKNSINAKSTSQTNRVGAVFIVGYAVAFLSVWLGLLTPAVITLALRIAEISPHAKEAHLAMVLGLGAVIAMLSNPVTGLLSDRTTSRLGMRRPWMLGGVLVGVFGALLIALTDNLTQVLVGWCLMQMGFNAVLATMTAVLPDQVPEDQRGMVSGLLGLSVQLAVVIGVAMTEVLKGSSFSMFLVPAGISVVGVLGFCVILNDRKLSEDGIDSLPLLQAIRSFWISPSKAPDFSWAFASRFLFFIGLATLVNNQVYYLIDGLGIPTKSVPQHMLISTVVITLTTVIGSIGCGWLSDVLKRRKIFVFLSATVYAIGLTVVGFASEFNIFLIGVGICGLGQGVYLAVDLALVSAVLPNKEKDAAKDLGIFNVASAMPQSIAPALAPIFLAVGAVGSEKNYGALFFAAAIFALLGALAIAPIRNVR